MLPAYRNKGGGIMEYTVADGETFTEGALVVLTAGEIEECGADPALILGNALSDAGADPDPTKILVNVLKSGSTLFMSGTRAPLASDIGVEYGVAKDASGIWVVDATETVNTCVVVEDVDLTRELFEISILPDNRQIG